MPVRPALLLPDVIETGTYIPSKSDDPRPILGLDLSLNSTGWCAIFPSGFWQAGILSPNKLTGLHRLVALRSKLTTLLTHVGAKLAVIENYSYGSTSLAHSIGEWGGVARLAVWESGTPMAEVEPMTAYYMTVDKSIQLDDNGNKRPKEKDLKKRLTREWAESVGLPHRQNDYCDAGMLAVVGRIIHHEPPIDRMRRERFNKLRRVEVLTPPRRRARAA